MDVKKCKRYIKSFADDNLGLGEFMALAPGKMEPQQRSSGRVGVCSAEGLGQVSAQPVQWVLMEAGGRSFVLE